MDKFSVLKPGRVRHYKDWYVGQGDDNGAGQEYEVPLVDEIADAHKHGVANSPDHH